MYLVIIGVALAALGLVAAAMTSRGQRVRIGAACVGAVGVLLLLVSWTNPTPAKNQMEMIRQKCRSAAMDLEFFETRRTSTPPYWSREEAQAHWSGMSDLVDPIAEICIENPSSCDGPLATNPKMTAFSAELAELADALRTGKPCRR